MEYREIECLCHWLYIEAEQGETGVAMATSFWWNNHFSVYIYVSPSVRALAWLQQGFLTNEHTCMLYIHHIIIRAWRQVAAAIKSGRSRTSKGGGRLKLHES